MKFESANINLLWASLIVDELVRNNIDYFCISPGSRSTPLTVAAARHPRAKTILCFDERGAAFHALGYGRATGRAAAMICTSGTAAANYYPAVIEASVDREPLLVLTADRPPELRDTGANQSIAQPGMYGSYVKWNFDLPCPDESISPRFVLTTIDQAVYQASSSPSGPVHLNCMFREPLAPSASPVQEAYLDEVKYWNEGDQSYTEYAAFIKLPLEADIEMLANQLNSTSKGILIVGKLHNRGEMEAARRLAEKLNWPVFADITSGLRLDDSFASLVPYYDQLLLSENFAKKCQPETVLHIGGQLVSKRWLEFMEKRPPEYYVVIQDHPNRYDPFHSVTHRIESDIAAFCAKLLPLVQPNGNKSWLNQIKDQSLKVHQSIETFLRQSEQINDVSAACLVSKHIAPGSGLFLASSMPVRDMDMYASPGSVEVSVASNRGVSGIDGTIASACGFAVGSGKPVTLMIGDLAFIHDLNSLHYLNAIAQPLIIVLLNNRGGGIFSFLPIAKFEDVFESYFGTPHQLHFKNAADLFGIDYYKPENNDAFVEIYTAAQYERRSIIIEVETDRAENKALHRQLHLDIVARLDTK